MGGIAVDLDRFDSDSDDAPDPAAAPRSAGASPSSPADTSGGGGTSKAARLRAKKAATRAAQRARRKQERARFPKDEAVDANGGSTEDDRGDVEKDGGFEFDAGSLDDDDDDDDDDVVVLETRKNASRADASRGVLNVEGVFVNDELFLLDRKSLKVYSSTRRAFDGTHLQVGVYVEETESIKRLRGEEIAARLKPPPSKTQKSKETLSQDEDVEEEHPTERRMEKPPTEVSHSFSVDPDDHCETSPEAHKNLLNFLAKIAEKKNKKPSELIIYDPYFCSGGTRRSFQALGFTNVINVNEDFYAVLHENRVPSHDVLVTNPPYSEDHVERCLTFAAANLAEHDRPYFLLLPSYVVNKPYYVDALLTGGAQGRARRSRTANAGAQEPTTTRDAAGAGGDAGASEGKAASASDDEVDDASVSVSRAVSEEPATMKVHDGSRRVLAGGKIRDVAVKKRSDGSIDVTESGKQTLPFYVAPYKRYYYWTPKALAGARRENQTQKAPDGTMSAKKRKKGHVGRLGVRTSPFPSFWCCGLGDAFQTDALRWHRKLPKAMVEGYKVAGHPNDLPVHVLDEWDPRRAKLRAAAAASNPKDASSEKSWKRGGKDGGGEKPPPRRFAGFSGANCGQNMPAKAKKRYAEFSDAGLHGKIETREWKNDADANWGNGKGSRDRDGGMFTRPRKKNKY